METKSQFIEDYLETVEGEVSLAKFITDNLEYIAANTCLTDDYASQWTNYFSKACQNKQRFSKPSTPDWGLVAVAMLQHARANADVTPTPTTPVSSSASSVATTVTATASTTDAPKKLNAEERKAVADMFASLDKAKMWRLSTGKLVEEQMAKVCIAATSETAAHSLIFDPSDPNWAEYFDDDELEEIKTFRAPQVSPPPAELQEFFDKFKGMKDLESIWDLNSRLRYHPLKHAVANWAHQSVARVLNLYYSNYLDNELSETDLLKHVYPFIETLFHPTAIMATSGEKASVSSSTALNKDRTDISERKKIGTKVDILFTAKLFEVGAVEAGKVSDRCSTKTVTEITLKCPKTLKCMLMEMQRAAPGALRELQCCGFIIAGLYLRNIVMDCPEGYICRVNALPDFFKFPSSAENLQALFFPLLHAVWDAREKMLRTKAIVTSNESAPIMSFTAKRPQLLPPCFTRISPAKTRSKKRKLETYSSST